MTVLKPFLILVFILLLQKGCSVEPEAGNTCKIQCDAGKTVPSNDMRIRFLSGTEGNLSLSCFDNTEKDYPIRVPIRFVIEKPRTTLPAEITSDNTDPVGGTKPEEVDAANWVPVSNVAFEPILEAGFAEAKEANNPDEDRYRGIMTNEAFWCTDQCGIGSIEVKPSCKTEATNSVVYRINAGGLSESIQIDVSQP